MFVTRETPPCHHQLGPMVGASPTMPVGLQETPGPARADETRHNLYLHCLHMLICIHLPLVLDRLSHYSGHFVTPLIF